LQIKEVMLSNHKQMLLRQRSQGAYSNAKPLQILIFDYDFQYIIDLFSVKSYT